jgi:hypothetical protein
VAAAAAAAAAAGPSLAATGTAPLGVIVGALLVIGLGIVAGRRGFAPRD